MQTIDFQTDPSRYRHWRIERDGDVAYLIMDVDPAGGLADQYELKLNSYDLAVDIELNDAVQRLRFEHPEVRCVVIKSGKDNVFCAGANIRMLGKSTHGQKVNFCKFTNETRLAIEDASENSKQVYLCAINGNAAGGGYELALAADHIMLVDDRRSAVALPETPLLAVLPGTGGLTRVTDKRKVRRDRADVFCSIVEGIRGSKAVEWRLVDEVVPNSKWKETVAARAHEIAARSDRPIDAKGIALTPLDRKIEADRVTYSHVDVEIDRARGLAAVTVRAVDLDVHMGIGHPVGLDLAVERGERDALGVYRPIRARGNFVRAGGHGLFPFRIGHHLVHQPPFDRLAAADALLDRAEHVGAVTPHLAFVGDAGEPASTRQHGEQRRLRQRHRRAAVVHQHLSLIHISEPTRP